MFDLFDHYCMARALQLARHGNYTTDPNPRVGCVIARDRQIIAEGWHEYAGGPHAEVMALRQCDDPRGATVYVTLEPCDHHGKTPPCSEALIAAQIGRVVVAMVDPNPRVAGRGVARLRAAGIDVACGLLEDDACALNRGFIQRMTLGRPWVVGKLAMSLDGRTAMASGESRWITSDLARQDVQYLRAMSSAVMTGVATVLADDPALNARLPEEIPVTQPWRVVLDSQLRTPPTARMRQIPGPILILTTENAPVARQQALEQAGFRIERVPMTTEHRVDLGAALRRLGEAQLNHVLLEAGPVLSGALLREELVDEWVIYLAPRVLGDEGRGLFHLPGLDRLADSIPLHLEHVRAVGPDLKMIFTKEK